MSDIQSEKDRRTGIDRTKARRIARKAARRVNNMIGFDSEHSIADIRSFDRSVAKIVFDAILENHYE